MFIVIDNVCCPKRPAHPHSVYMTENFEAESATPLFVKFYAPWCGHCVALVSSRAVVSTVSLLLRLRNYRLLLGTPLPRRFFQDFLFLSYSNCSCFTKSTQVESELAGKAKVAKVDCTVEADLASKYDIRGKSLMRHLIHIVEFLTLSFNSLNCRVPHSHAYQGGREDPLSRRTGRKLALRIRAQEC
jgi:thiol-disulfide isomerase/thioredoxin